MLLSRQHSQPRRQPTIFRTCRQFFQRPVENEPFHYAGELRIDPGLKWTDIDRSSVPILADILDRATHPDLLQRFSSAPEMLRALNQNLAVPVEKPSDATVSQVDSDSDTHFHRTDDQELQELSEQRVDWLKSLLQSYPGSRWGNQETRGLDTRFAADTYVATPLEQSLLDDIRNRRVRLVVLCGNAGDGKTALLQHLAQNLGLGRHSSSERILDGRVNNGPKVRMNLDGSAAWKGRSADQILDDFLAPFQNGPPSQDVVHLLAVNDGRLLEWIESVEERSGESPLTSELYSLLQQDSPSTESHIRFISLNQRSLVGGILPDATDITTDH